MFTIAFLLLSLCVIVVARETHQVLVKFPSSIFIYFLFLFTFIFLVQLLSFEQLSGLVVSSTIRFVIDPISEAYL